LIKTFSNYDCLLIDELGYVELEPVQVGLFFTLMQKRHKKKTTLITSNLGFEQWVSFLKNDHLTAALIDRLTEVSHIVNGLIQTYKIADPKAHKANENTKACR